MRGHVATGQRIKPPDSYHWFCVHRSSLYLPSPLLYSNVSCLVRGGALCFSMFVCLLRWQPAVSRLSASTNSRSTPQRNVLKPSVGGSSMPQPAEGPGWMVLDVAIVCRADLPLASANSDMIRWGRVLLSHTLDAARSY